MWQPSCSHSSTIYEIQLEKTIVLPMQPQHEATLTQPFTLRGTILQLQSTMEFHRQLLHLHHLQSHLQWGNDPRVANHNGIPSATHPPATTCNPIYIAGTILQLQITMEFCRPHMHEKQLKPHLQCGTDPRPIRGWSEDDPTTHETVSHPSHSRGRSSTFEDALCMEKHRPFVHLLSLKNAFRARLPPKLHRQLLHLHHLQSHLHCGNDPTVANSLVQWQVSLFHLGSGSFVPVLGSKESS